MISTNNLFLIEIQSFCNGKVCKKTEKAENTNILLIQSRILKIYLLETLNQIPSKKCSWKRNWEIERSFSFFTISWTQIINLIEIVERSILLCFFIYFSIDIMKTLWFSFIYSISPRQTSTLNKILMLCEAETSERLRR